MPDNHPPKSPLKNSLPTAHAASSRTPPPPSEVPGVLSESQKQQYLKSNPNADPRHLAIALQHAERIQAQKDTEALILDHILHLTTLPTNTTTDPSTPTPDDAHTFKSALRLFQPTDYDNLIQERNVEGLCGYTLCGRDRRRGEAGASHSIVWGAKGSGRDGRGREMNIVPREKVEMWCSDECAQRAMYVRVQLAEEPAWERRADDTRAGDIVLLEEGRRVEGKREKGKGRQGPGLEATALAEDVGRLKIQDDARALALERGEASSATPGGKVDVRIREREQASGATRSPELREGEEHGGSVEGHVPKAAHTTGDSDEEREDLLDQF